MATDKIPGREREPTANAARSLLNTVKAPDEKSSLKDPKAKDIIDKVVKCFNDNAKYDKEISNASVTATIEQTRALLNQLNKEQIKPALEEIKEEVSSTSLKSIIGSLVMSQLTSIFDNDASKDDIEDLKEWMSSTFGDKSSGEEEKSTQLSKEDLEELSEKLDESFKDFGDVTEPISDAGEVAEDNEEGDYKDSTPAENFNTLQDFVNTQFDSLNEKLKNVPGQSGILSHISTSLAKGFSSASSFFGKGIARIMGGIGSISKKTLGIAGAVGTIGIGIKSIGGKIGGALASPFKKVGNTIKSLNPIKKIGGFVKSLNPFKSSEKKAEERKEKNKDKFFAVMTKILEKIWKAIEPFIDKVGFFMGIVTKLVVVPIAIIMAKILLVVAAITAIGIAAYLAYKWVKEKIARFWEYITSGELLDDIVAGLLKVWGWLKDFGKWLWDITLKAIKYIFWDMWIDLGKWIWKKLCEFGQWLYDKFIGPYIVEPFKKYVWEPLKKLWNEKIWPTIQPFVQSLTELYEKIKKAFSAWDTNKSIWENLKNIGGIIKDSIAEWWQTSPFKVLWDTKIWPTIEPFIKSITNLYERIKTIWSNFKWDESKSFLENLKGLASTIKDGVIEWWKDDNNPIRKFYNEHVEPIIGKVTNFFKDMFATVKSWWNDSKVGQWVNGLQAKIEVLKQKMGSIVLKVPFFGFVRPFGPVAGLPFKLSDSEADDYEKFGKRMGELDKEDEKDKARMAEIDKKLENKDFGWFENEEKLRHERAVLMQRQKRNAKERQTLENAAANKHQQQIQVQAKDIAQQQVSQALKSIDAVNNVSIDASQKLDKEGQQMSQQMQEKEEKAEQKDQESKEMLWKIYQKQVETDDNVVKYGKDPSAIPVPVQSSSSSQDNNSMNSIFFNANYGF